MEENRIIHKVQEIQGILTNALTCPGGEMVRSIAVGVTEILDPITGTFVGMANDISLKYNDYKLILLIKGLSRGLDMEKTLNDLYNYVNSSDSKATAVANLFRKTINAECPRVCFIYGLILADHTANGSDFTQDELIVCKALENATEFDLVNFKEIMEKHTKPERNAGKKAVLLSEQTPNYSEMIATCDWCVYNRLFVSEVGEYGREEETLDLTPNYYVRYPAAVLMEYVEKASREWDYRSSFC